MGHVYALTGLPVFLKSPGASRWVASMLNFARLHMSYLNYYVLVTEETRYCIHFNVNRCFYSIKILYGGIQLSSELLDYC